jgi:hypothetical protein
MMSLGQNSNQLIKPTVLLLLTSFWTTINVSIAPYLNITTKKMRLNYTLHYL